MDIGGIIRSIGESNIFIYRSKFQNIVEVSNNLLIRSHICSIITVNESSTLSMWNSTVSDISMSRCEGGFAHIMNSDIYVNNSDFQRINSFRGGVLKVDARDSLLFLYDSVFRDNYATF